MAEFDNVLPQELLAQRRGTIYKPSFGVMEGEALPSHPWQYFLLLWPEKCRFSKERNPDFQKPLSALGVFLAFGPLLLIRHLLFREMP